MIFLGILRVSGMYFSVGDLIDLKTGAPEIAIKLGGKGKSFIFFY